MAGITNDKGNPIEVVKIVSGRGSALLKTPWGRNQQTVEADPEAGRHIFIDWRKRVVVLEAVEGDKLVGRTYVPLEGVDYAQAVVE